MTKHARILLLAAAALVLLVVPTAQAKFTRASAAVTVTEGKPSEFGIKLSVKKVAHGAVTFNVTNAGNVPHDFKLCTAPIAGAPVDTCKGKGTKMISPGAKATLSVTIAKAGKYEYLCTVPGHATAGMKGVLTVT
jgi:uncharacterized cupredoxin-like copper-binding protein